MTPLGIVPKVCGIQVPVTSTQVSAGGACSPLTATFRGKASAAQQAICMRVTYHCPFFLEGVTKPVSLTSRPVRDFLSSSQARPMKSPTVISTGPVAASGVKELRVWSRGGGVSSREAANEPRAGGAIRKIANTGRHSSHATRGPPCAWSWPPSPGRS